MASSLFSNSKVSSSPVFPNGRQGIIERFNEFRRQMTPEQAQSEVQRLRTSGQMSEQQFQMLSMIAKSIGGK